MLAVTAKAHINIALIKYWGKQNSKLNIPECSSLSMTLDKFYTSTKVIIGTKKNKLYINNQLITDNTYDRVFNFIDIITIYLHTNFQFTY